MSKYDNNRPLFAYETLDFLVEDNSGNGSKGPLHYGMTLRDYFAVNAMQALLSKQGGYNGKLISHSSYEIADAMLLARQGG